MSQLSDDRHLLRIKKYIFPPVDADAGASPKESSKMQAETSDEESEEESEEQDIEAAQPKKKFRKDKIGFRDRKVIYLTKCLRPH